MEKDGTYKPLPEFLELRESIIEGTGLFTTIIIERGTTGDNAFIGLEASWDIID